MATTDPGLNLAIVDTQDKSCTVRVSAQGYAHAVHLDLPAGAVPSDDYFDLLPGQSSDIQITSSQLLDAEYDQRYVRERTLTTQNGTRNTKYGISNTYHT